MNPLDPVASATSLLDQLSRASGQQRLLRLLTVAGTLLFPALLAAAGGGPLGAAAVVVGVVGLSVALLPDSNAPLVWTLLAAGLWVLSVPESLSGWTLAVAADLLLVHLTCTLASYGPSVLSLPGWLLRQWGVRGAVLLAVTTLVWLTARLLGGLDLPASPWVYGAALAAVTGWAAYLLPRLLARDGEDAVGHRS